MSAQAHIGENGNRSTTDRFERFAPTLLIGLGGTGIKTLRRVKHRLRQAFPGQETLHRFLFVDTDKRSFSHVNGLADVHTSEIALIGARKVKDVLENPDYYPHLWERFDQETLGENHLWELMRGRGASQIRSVGAFAFALDYERIRSGIQEGYNDLIALSRNIPELRRNAGAVELAEDVPLYAVVVGSLAGGTGSGCCLDIPPIIYDVAGKESIITGMFALPAAFDSHHANPTNRWYTRSNVYAALMELQFLVDQVSGENGDSKVESIELDYGRGNGSLKLWDSSGFGKRPMHYANLLFVDDKNLHGRLDSTDELYDLMARSIYRDVASPYGANADSAQSNMVTANGLSVDRETKKPRKLGSLAVASLVFPTKRIAHYSGLRLSSRILHDFLLGKELPEETVEAWIGEFLEKNELDERSGRQYLIQKLLPEDPLYFAERIPRIESLEGRSNSEFADKIVELWGDLTTNDLVELEVAAQTRRQALLAPESESDFSVLIPSFLLSVAADVENGGAIVARQHAVQLAITIDELLESLRSENKGWEDRRSALEHERDDLADELSQVGRLRSAFSSKDDRLRGDLFQCLERYLRQAARHVGRKRAVEVLDAVRSVVALQKVHWEQIADSLDHEHNKLKTEIRRSETGAGSQHGRGIVLDQQISAPGYEAQYFNETWAKRDDVQGLVGEIGETVAIELRGEREGPDLRDFFLLINEGKMEGMVSAARRALASYVSTQLEPMSDIVDFVFQNPESCNISGMTKDPEEILKRNLNALLAIATPFWPAKRIGNQVFDSYIALIAPEYDRDEDGRPRPAKVVRDWMDAQEAQNVRINYIPSPDSSEISISIRTYGARGHYFRPAARWRLRYKNRQDEIPQLSHAYKYSMHVHRDLENLPDLFPPPKEDTRPKMLFAAAMALGLIVNRGDWYYKALQCEDRDGEERLRVLYEPQDWPTIFDCEEGVLRPDNAGQLDFSSPFLTIRRTQHKLEQGRANALDVFETDEEFQDLVARAFDEYHKSVGNTAMREALEAYIEKALEPKSRGGDIFESEMQFLKERINRIGR